MSMTKGIRRLMASLVLFGIIIMTRVNVEAGINLTDYLPAGARIVQAITDPAFDRDPKDEILLLVEQGMSRWVCLLDPSAYGYSQIYRVDLGRAGYFRRKGSEEYYTLMQTGDVNADGITDFWLVFSPDGKQGEIQVHVSQGGIFRKVAEVRADVDLQFVNYRGEWVIHEVNLEPDQDRTVPEDQELGLGLSPDNGQGTVEETDQETGWFFRVKSHVFQDGRFVSEDQEYRFSAGDYWLFAEARWRPQIFKGREESGQLKYRFGESMIPLMIPKGRAALEALLPSKAFLLDYLPDAALDLDTDVEYLLAYLVPDPADERRVLLQAGIADWSHEQRAYQLTLLDCKNYGLGRYPEGRFYQPIYLVQGEGLSHPVVVGNAAADKPMLQLTAYANTGEGFVEAASIQANYYLWMTENVGPEGLYYRVIAADLQRNGLVTVRPFVAKADGSFGGYGFFAPENGTAMSLREFKRSYYRSEETEWTSQGYETPILRTNPEKVPAFNGVLPDTEKGVVDVEDYIAKHMAALRIRSWFAGDLNRDGAMDHLALFRTDHQGWPPQYRLGYFSQGGGQLHLQPIGAPLKLGEGNPATGVYFVDLDLNEENGRELVLVRRGLHQQTGRQRVNVEFYRLTNGSWVRLHTGEVWYDEFQLFKSSAGVELAGFQLDAAGKSHGQVYEFTWRDGWFHLQKKVPVLSFQTYLSRIQGKTPLLQPGEAVWQLR
jgi:hypothetical protein